MEVNSTIHVVMMGALEVSVNQMLNNLLNDHFINRVTALGRSTIMDTRSPKLVQSCIALPGARTHQHVITGYVTAIFKPGVDEPSKESREDFIAVHKVAVLAFAKACKANHILHLQLLASVEKNVRSYNFFLKTKGKLVEAFKILNRETLCILQPFMILKPINSYGLSQAITLKLRPFLKPLLQGIPCKYCDISMATLVKAMASYTQKILRSTHKRYRDKFNRLTV